MMKRSLISVLSLLMLVLCIPALAESTDWNYDANYAILLSLIHIFQLNLLRSFLER